MKNTEKIRGSDLKGLKSFLEDYPMAEGTFLYRGSEKIQKGKILCVPVEEFRLDLESHLNSDTQKTFIP